MAKSPDEAQTLLHHAQYYYTAASATLCAPKSVWTGTRTPGAWRIELFFPRSEYQVTEEEVSLLATECRAWQKERSPTAGPRAPAHPADVRAVAGKAVILSRDQLYLEGLGDSVRWQSQSQENKPLSYSTSLLAHLERKRHMHGAQSLIHHVVHRPLHLVNPRTGEREYLQWVPPEKPVRYLGIHISTATLDWGPECQVLLNKLNPLLRQIKAGRKLGLAWDVFVQAAATAALRCSGLSHTTPRSCLLGRR